MHGSLFIEISSNYFNIEHQDRTSPSIICFIIGEIRTIKYPTKDFILLYQFTLKGSNIDSNLDERELLQEI